ncbi:SBBP repeat-containing protein [candidate division WOR-3 bacterium]|nr:SBBP repeat-containing protein [candidate division WOR-3 bacterium]
MKKSVIVILACLVIAGTGFAQITEEWVARYGPADECDIPREAIAVDGTGNIYVTGMSRVSGTSGDYVTIKYNTSGVQEWAVAYDGPANNNDDAKAIAIDNTGNIYVTGESVGISTLEDYATVKYNPSGIQEWVIRYDGPESDFDDAYAVAIDDADNVFVTGWSHGYYATIKYSQGPAVSETPVTSPIQLTATLNRLSYNLPGEAKLSVFSSDGRKVVEETVEGQGIWLAPTELSQGVYFVKLTTGDYSAKTKLIVVR